MVSSCRFPAACCTSSTSWPREHRHPIRIWVRFPSPAPRLVVTALARVIICPSTQSRSVGHVPLNLATLCSDRVRHHLLPCVPTGRPVAVRLGLARGLARQFALFHDDCRHLRDAGRLPDPRVVQPGSAPFTHLIYDRFERRARRHHGSSVV